MFVAIDLYYSDTNAKVSAIAFENISDVSESSSWSTNVSNVIEYKPGAFYERELPGILDVLQKSSVNISCVIIDAYVYLNRENTRLGLGAYLYEKLNCKIPVIGVAKNKFQDAPDEWKVFRGESLTPLYVNSAGIDLNTAKQMIVDMHGQYRIPTLLKRVDSLSRM